MSKSYDQRRQIKLSPANQRGLIKSQKAQQFKVSLNSIANRAIELGLPELLQPTKPQAQ